MEEQEGTYDSPNHPTPIRYRNRCRVASPLWRNTQSGTIFL